MMVKRLLLTTVNGLIRPELVAFKFTFFVLIISLYVFTSLAPIGSPIPTSQLN